MSNGKEENSFEDDSKKYFKEALNFLYNNKCNENDLKVYFKFANYEINELKDEPVEVFINDILEKFRNRNIVNYVVGKVGKNPDEIKLKLNDYDKECIKILYDIFEDNGRENDYLKNCLGTGERGYDRLKKSIYEMYISMCNENEECELAKYTHISYYLQFIQKAILGGKLGITVTADAKVEYMFNEENIREVFHDNIARAIFIQKDQGYIKWEVLTLRLIKNILTGDINCDSFFRKEIESCKVINNERTNILLKGVPGTGKSWLIEQDIDKKFEQTNILRINIHSASSNSDLMQGIGVYLTEEENSKIKYTEKKGLVLNFILKAICIPDKKFALVLEEIQENSLNELIGDLIYLIEEEKRTSTKYIKAIMNKYSFKDKSCLDKEEIFAELIEKVIEGRGKCDGQTFQNRIYYVNMPQLIEDNPKFKKIIIPDNLYIYCTTNYREDKKIIEDNLFRRFEVIDIFPEKSALENTAVQLFFEELNDVIIKVMSEVDEVHPDRYLIGHANWIKVNEDTDFYRAFLKLVNEFKEIREIEFEKFKEIIKEIKLKNTNENVKSDNNEEQVDIHKDSTITISKIIIILEALKNMNNYYELIRYLKDNSKYEICNNSEKKYNE